MGQTIRVTKPGKDALTSTTPDDYYLHSDYPLLKVHSTGNFSFSVAAGSTTVTHSLGYKPFVFVFSQTVNHNGTNTVVSADYYQHDWIQEGATKTWWGYTRIGTSTITIHVGQTDAISGGTVNGFYYIFKDET